MDGMGESVLYMSVVVWRYGIDFWQALAGWTNSRVCWR